MGASVRPSVRPCVRAQIVLRKGKKLAPEMYHDNNYNYLLVLSDYILLFMILNDPIFVIWRQIFKARPQIYYI